MSKNLTDLRETIEQPARSCLIVCLYLLTKQILKYANCTVMRCDSLGMGADAGKLFV